MSKKNKKIFSEKDVDKVFPKLCINQKIIDSFNGKEIEDTHSNLKCLVYGLEVSLFLQREMFVVKL